MSHYAEYLHGSMDEDEFKAACRMEFAGDDYPDEIEKSCDYCAYCGSEGCLLGCKPDDDECEFEVYDDED